MKQRKEKKQKREKVAKKKKSHKMKTENGESTLATVNNQPARSRLTFKVVTL